MADCRYCGRRLFTVSDRHGVCGTEWNRRWSARKCIKCGEREMPDDDPYCAECNRSNDTPYVGYPQAGD